MEQGTGTCSTFETKKKDRPFQTAPIFLSHTRAYAQRGGNCRQYANDGTGDWYLFQCDNKTNVQIIKQQDNEKNDSMSTCRYPDLRRKCIHGVFQQRRQSRNPRPQSQREDYREVDTGRNKWQPHPN